MNWFSAVALLIQDNRVLAMSRGNDLNNLGLPGGKRDEHDLTPNETAMRELYEETGLHAPDGPGEIYAAPGNTGICRVFLYTEWSGKLRGMSREGLPIWVPPEMLLRRCAEYHPYYEKMYAALRSKSIL